MGSPAVNAYNWGTFPELRHMPFPEPPYTDPVTGKDIPLDLDTALEMARDFKNYPWYREKPPKKGSKDETEWLKAFDFYPNGVTHYDPRYGANVVKDGNNISVISETDDFGEIVEIHDIEGWIAKGMIGPASVIGFKGDDPGLDIPVEPVVTIGGNMPLVDLAEGEGN